MDDLGSEQICKLSCNKKTQQQKTNNSAIYYDYDNTTTTTANTNATSTAINESGGASVASTISTTTAALAAAASASAPIIIGTTPITTINNGGSTSTTAATTTKSSPIIKSENYDGRFDKQHTTTTMLMKKKPSKMNKKNDFEDDDSDIMYKNSSNSITPISISSGNDSSPEQQQQQQHKHEHNHHHRHQQQYNQMMMEATAGYGGGSGDGNVDGGGSFGDDDSDEKEKTDVTPENMKKLDDVILASTRCSGRGGNTGRRRIDMKSSAGVCDIKSRKDCDNFRGSSGGGSGVGSGIDDDNDDNNIELKIVEDESPTKQNLAFTIEFSEGESTSATAVRYKNMVERFQNRHRRGASLSKLDDNHSSNNPIGTPPIAGGRTSRVMSAVVNQRQQQKHTGSGMQSNETNQNSEAYKVKLRIRDRSTSGVRDASKRHSWSPRSSIHEPFETQQQQQQQHLKHREKQTILKGINSGNMVTNKESVVNYQRQTTITPSSEKLHSKIGKKTAADKIPASPHLEDNSTKTSKTFTPRSTAMQLALNKVEFLCPEPPLDFCKVKNVEDDDDNGDSVSETGTYTVDGDNYTEEQKEQMNIDKSAAKFTSGHQLSDLKIDSAQQIRPSELSLHTTNNNNIENQRRNNNILEINYYHDSTSLKPKISYLEKIKSRVRNIAKSPDKKLKPSDVGIFTSVTTSGVLSIKPTLDPHPKVNRRNSLSKSHVDSSEYISADSSSLLKGCRGTNTAADKSPYSSMFTDHQKAEYKLNLFSTTINQTDSQILNENYSDVDTPITPDSPTNSFSKSIISETGLKTAQTKNDWIQEWARNARARSQSATTTSSKIGNEQMSRSYNFEAVDSIEFGDSSANDMYHNKAIIDRLRSHGIGDLEYSSDPNVSILKNANITTNNSNSGNMLSTRPPMSPSKIPSPMHSIGRARSVSRTRGSLQDLSPSKTAVAAAAVAPTDSTDIYLQKTAAAISNLTQSFSRKNSLQSTATAATKSPPSSSTGNSPRHRIFPQHFSADEYSPTHTKHHYSNHHSGHHQHHLNVHKRNLSLDYRNNLMSHSLNTETLTTILGNEKQRTNQSNRSRQHSYDGAGYESPKLFQRKTYIDQTTGCLSSTKQSQPQQQSPIRRSSSFSTRPMSNSSSGRQQQQQNSNSSRNIKKSTGLGQNPIQKSASSTSFRKMYSDYDDSVAYYINDEDDLIDAEYCLSSDEFDDSDHGECYVPPIPAAESEPSEPLTNTRYNKALLMRIERSKQRVANMQGKPSSGGGGVVACPNTPEMPRRAVQSAGQRASIRQSVPRDSSLSRLKAEVPNSLASAKKHLLQTVASSSATTTSVGSAASNTGKKVQPKYMDISKYKPVQSANFLRKDDKKSTLITRSTDIKRSPSSASVALNRTDPTRASNRSVKSLNSRSACGSKREPPSASKQKEVELAMWRRRATYDPMKAAAEDRKKKEEAKRLAQSQIKSTDSSSIVTRSQSFHSGVTLMSSTSSKLQFYHNHSDFRNNDSNVIDFNDDDDDDDNEDGDKNDDAGNDDDIKNVCVKDNNEQLNTDYDLDNAAAIKSIKINNSNNNNKYRWSSTEYNNRYGRNTIGCIQGVNDDDEEDEN